MRGARSARALRARRHRLPPRQRNPWPLAFRHRAEDFAESTSPPGATLPARTAVGLLLADPGRAGFVGRGGPAPRPGDRLAARENTRDQPIPCVSYGCIPFRSRTTSTFAGRRSCDSEISATYNARFLLEAVFSAHRRGKVTHVGHRY